MLIVDDEDVLRTTLGRVLRQRGMICALAENAFEALEQLERDSFDVILVDVQMPGMTGPQFLQRVKTAGYAVEVIMMTAYADIKTTVSAVKLGAFGFLTKPFVSNEAVVIEVANAAQFKKLREKNDRLQRELSARSPTGDFVGNCASMREVYRMISGVATTSSTILILGESGTGKELVARAVHEKSRRANKPMIAVNCAAIPKELVESELFGHTHGAFTSAVSARAGLFEAANGGTIFLDEIGDLPLNVQVKLLRTLQQGEVKPVGSDSVKTVDVRIIAATNADLKASIAAGTFRQDLFYRLNVIAVRLPPLRERGDDVLFLAHHFVLQHAQTAGRIPAPRLSPEAAMCIQRYDWPGNVRELEHAMEHAVVLSESDVIEPRALPFEVRRANSRSIAPPMSSSGIASSGVASSGAESASAPASSGRIAVSGGSGPLSSEMPLSVVSHATQAFDGLSYADAKKRALASFNEAYIESVVKAAAGNMSEAARRAGLDRSNFRRLLKSTSGGGGAPDE